MFFVVFTAHQYSVHALLPKTFAQKVYMFFVVFTAHQYSVHALLPKTFAQKVYIFFVVFTAHQYSVQLYMLCCLKHLRKRSIYFLSSLLPTSTVYNCTCSVA